MAVEDFFVPFRPGGLLCRLVFLALLCELVLPGLLCLLVLQRAEKFAGATEEKNFLSDSNYKPEHATYYTSPKH